LRRRRTPEGLAEATFAEAKGRIMSGIIILSVLSALTLWGAIGSIVVAARDDYRRVPTHR
jgi:hypothetical protein